MNLPYARVTVSAHDAALLRTSVPCLDLKNNAAHGLSISKCITPEPQRET